MRLIGHLHPLLVHLPIGFLLLGMLFLWLSYREKYASLGLAANISIVVGAIAALLACFDDKSFNGSRSAVNSLLHG